MDQFRISVFIHICAVLHNNALKTLQERQAPWTQNIKTWGMARNLCTALYMWFTKTNTALCLYKLFNLHFQHKVLMQSMCLNCEEYRYVRWDVLSCRDSSLPTLFFFFPSSPSLPLCFSALSPFQLCVLEATFPLHHKAHILSSFHCVANIVGND